MRRWQCGEFFTNDFIGDSSWNGHEHDVLMRNDRNGETFTDVAHVTGIDLTSDGRGMTYLDYDQDGDLDVAVVCHRQPAVILRNDCCKQNHWLHVALAGTKSNRQGVGARIEVVTGDRAQIREVRAGGGFLQAQSIPEAFGLGQATSVNQVRVRWPSGLEQVVENVDVDRTIRIVEGESAL
jgi:hypothetical protein